MPGVSFEARQSHAESATPGVGPCTAGRHVCGTYDETGDLDWQAVWGPRIDQLLEWRDRDGSSDYIAMLDHRNSVVGTWDIMSGELDAIVDYTADGRVTSRNVREEPTCVEEGNFHVQCDGPSGMPFGFNARWRSDVTGLTNMRARWYSARHGQFTSHDPLGYIDTQNLYAFAAFDPINGWDPYGLSESAQTETEPSKPDRYEVLRAGYDEAFYGAFQMLGCGLMDYCKPHHEEVNRRVGKGAAKESLNIAFHATVVLPLLAKPNDASPPADPFPIVGDDEQIGADLATAYSIVWAVQTGALLNQKTAGRAGKASDEVGTDAARGACSGPKCDPKCFTAGTLVAVSDNQGLRAIEDVELGDRVPQLDGATCSAEPFAEDLDSCRVIRLEFDSPYGYDDKLLVELMRPADWLAANGAVEGEHVWLAFEEIKVDSPGVVTEVTSCPSFKPEPEAGCLVTGTFQHRNRDVMRIGFEDSDVVLEPTALHPFWSVERDDWIRAGELEPGHELRTDGGTIQVASVEWLTRPEQVYNLEVAGDHYYLVSEARVLSHNNDGCGPPIKVNLLDIPPVRLSNPAKLRKQMKKRGWSKRKIHEAMQTDGIPTQGKHGPATRYEHPESGASVVVDDSTGEVFHVGKPGWAYDDYQ